MDVWILLALWLIQQHRRKQDLIADTVASSIGRSWRHVDFENLDDSTPLWLDVALPPVRYGFERSQMATARFLEDYRTTWSLATDSPVAELPKIVTARQFSTPVLPGGPGRTPASEFDERKVARALATTGPARVKRAMPTVRDVAMAKGLRGAVGAAVAHAMDGGRGVTIQEAERDGEAVGYQRVTDSNPCAFCALLAANGPVYKANAFNDSNSTRHVTRRAKRNVQFVGNAAFEATGEPDGIAKVHDHCRCQLVPVYEEWDSIDPMGQVASVIWGKVVKNFSGEDALREYSRRYRRLRETGITTVENDVDPLELLRQLDAELLKLDDSGSSARFIRSQIRTLRAA